MSQQQYADIDADILGSPGKGKWSQVWAINLRGEKAVLPIRQLLVTIADSCGKWTFTKENFFGGMISEISVCGQVAPLLTVGPVVVKNIVRSAQGLKVTHPWQLKESEKEDQGKVPAFPSKVFLHWPNFLQGASTPSSTTDWLPGL